MGGQTAAGVSALFDYIAPHRAGRLAHLRDLGRAVLAAPADGTDVSRAALTGS
jgi:hypothetical protein